MVMCALGLGIGFQLPTGLVATQNAVPPSQVGLATALTAFSRMLGGAVGIAVLTSILIAINRRYKVPGAGIRITGISDAPPCSARESPISETKTGIEIRLPKQRLQ